MPPRTRGSKRGGSSSTRAESSRAVASRRGVVEAAIRSRLQELLKRPIESNKFIVDDDLETIGIQEEIHAFIHRIGWETFVTIQEPAYPHLLCEFLSSIIFHDVKARTPDRPHTIQFIFGGQIFSMSISEFGVACGLYTEAETHTEEYQLYLMNYPPQFTAAQAWEEVAPRSGAYSARYTKSTALPTLTLRFLHRYITYTINGRGDSNGSVTGDDLFYLWCMVTTRKCNMGYRLAKYFHHKSKQNTGRLCGGSYITRLARNLGILDPIPRNAVRLDMQPLTTNTLIRMGIIFRDPNGRIQFVDEEAFPGAAETEIPEETAPPAPQEEISTEEVPVPSAAPPTSIPSSSRASRPPHVVSQQLSMRLQRLEGNVQQISGTLEIMDRRQRRMERALRQFFQAQNIPYPSSSSSSTSATDGSSSS